MKFRILAIVTLTALARIGAAVACVPNASQDGPGGPTTRDEITTTATDGTNGAPNAIENLGFPTTRQVATGMGGTTQTDLTNPDGQTNTGFGNGGTGPVDGQGVTGTISNGTLNPDGSVAVNPGGQVTIDQGVVNFNGQSTLLDKDQNQGEVQGSNGTVKFNSPNPQSQYLKEIVNNNGTKSYEFTDVGLQWLADTTNASSTSASQAPSGVQVRGGKPIVNGASLGAVVDPDPPRYDSNVNYADRQSQ